MNELLLKLAESGVTIQLRKDPFDERYIRADFEKHPHRSRRLIDIEVVMDNNIAIEQLLAYELDTFVKKMSEKS